MGSSEIARGTREPPLSRLGLAYAIVIAAMLAAQALLAAAAAETGVPTFEATSLR